MADIEKGLPIRTEDDPDQYTRVRIYDETSSLQGVTVDSDNNMHVQIMGDRADDQTEVALRLSELGNVNPDGFYEVNDNSLPGSVGLIAQSRNATPGPTLQTERLTSIEDSGGTVRALDVSLHDEAGESYSGTNPLPVTFEASEGTEVHDFSEGVDVAAGATSNHDYSVATGDTFLLQQVLGASSTRHKITLQVGDGAVGETFSTIAVKFGSEDTQNADIILAQPVIVVGTANTTTVRVIRENRDDDDAASIYSTIVGLTQA